MDESRILLSAAGRGCEELEERREVRREKGGV